jgi:hypothetical protein
MKTFLRFHAEREFLRNTIAIHLAGESGAQGTAVAMPVVFSIAEEDRAFSEPMLRLTMKDGQNLIDELWNAGLRPTEGTGSAGSLAATERHLKDMQTITMHMLKITKGTA